MHPPALAETGTGQLYSIDYPHYADEPLSEFREKTFEEYGCEVIPSNKSPGWIVPDRLRDAWTLQFGKSQREFPHLLTELEQLDLFFHDSEHSVPSMFYELELAWEWLSDGGVILADDINWNDAFETFQTVRKAESGRLAPDIGFLRK